MKSFIAANGIMLLSLLFDSSLVHAVTIDVEYQGEVYAIDGDGLGYSVGDSIFGSLSINTDVAPADDSPSTARGDYNLSNSSGGFVDGYAPNDVLHDEFVRVRDQFRGNDYFAVEDSSSDYIDNSQGTFSGNTTGVSLYAKDRLLDFITGDGLEQDFIVTDADVLDTFQGEMFQGFWEYVDYQQVYDIWNGASFRLTSLSVMTHVASPVATVPEPGTIALFCFGLAGLGFTRRVLSNRDAVVA